MLGRRLPGAGAGAAAGLGAAGGVAGLREAGPGGKKGRRAGLGLVLGRGEKKKRGQQAEREEGEEMEGNFLFLFINKIFKLIFKRFLKSSSI